MGNGLCCVPDGDRVGVERSGRGVFRVGQRRSERTGYAIRLGLVHPFDPRARASGNRVKRSGKGGRGRRPPAGRDVDTGDSRSSRPTPSGPSRGCGPRSSTALIESCRAGHWPSSCSCSSGPGDAGPSSRCRPPTRTTGAADCLDKSLPEAVRIEEALPIRVGPFQWHVSGWAMCNAQLRVWRNTSGSFVPSSRKGLPPWAWFFEFAAPGPRAVCSAASFA